MMRSEVCVHPCKIKKNVGLLQLRSSLAGRVLNLFHLTSNWLQIRYSIDGASAAFAGLFGRKKGWVCMARFGFLI